LLVGLLQILSLLLEQLYLLEQPLISLLDLPHLYDQVAHLFLVTFLDINQLLLFGLVDVFAVLLGPFCFGPHGLRVDLCPLGPCLCRIRPPQLLAPLLLGQSQLSLMPLTTRLLLTSFTIN
jgi:hypothetical protein